MIFISWKEFAAQLSESESSVKRREHADSYFPLKVQLSPHRVAFRADHCTAYLELLYLRTRWLRGDFVEARMRVLEAFLRGDEDLDEGAADTAVAHHQHAEAPAAE